MKTTQDSKSGQEVAKQSGQASPSRFHIDYWKERLYRKTFTREGKTFKVPEWSVRLQHLGRREAFALSSANAQVAAAKAKEIATFLDANGWEGTLAKFKPSVTPRADVCTVGEFLDDVREHSHLKPTTVRRYALKLRKIAADIAKVDAGAKGRAKFSKYDYVNGGHKAWLTKVEALRLDILTRDSVIAWRNAYVAKAGDDPVKRKSAERSAASYLRCARSLFTADILEVLKVRCVTSPFAGVKLNDPGSQRYHSDVNPEWLMARAGLELRSEHPQLYLALFLSLWAGLRRKEADLLTWEQVDFQQGQIHIRRTSYFEPKTEESERSIDLDAGAMEVLGTFKRCSVSEFVLDGAEPNPAATYDYYRCDRTFRSLHAWLAEKGVGQRKKIHGLRKESGSLINSTHGIEAARQHLGHGDIRTTSSIYVDKKKRIEVRLPHGV